MDWERYFLKSNVFHIFEPASRSEEDAANIIATEQGEAATETSDQPQIESYQTLGECLDEIIEISRRLGKKRPTD